MKMNDKHGVNHVNFWLKKSFLANLQNWPTKTYAKTIFWHINNMCKNAGSWVCPYFEQNTASFNLVNKTGAKRISYGYHGNASSLPAAKFRGLFGHYYSEGQFVPWDHKQRVFNQILAAWPRCLHPPSCPDTGTVPQRIKSTWLVDIPRFL